MAGSISIEEAVAGFQDLLDHAIRTGGVDGKNAAIRSGRPINLIHDAVKAAFIAEGIAAERLAPALGTATGELKLTGFIKQKKQDVCIRPLDLVPQREDGFTGLLDDASDAYGTTFTERTIVVNVRSQISSLDKNFDTLFERTIAEAQNLHVRCPRVVMGEVYMIAVPEYDVDALKRQVVAHSTRAPKVAKYVKAFNAINNRRVPVGSDHCYERVCLLVVDFRPAVPVIHHAADSLKDAGLIAADSALDLSGLGWHGFARDLLAIHEERFHDGVVQAVGIPQ